MSQPIACPNCRNPIPFQAPAPGRFRFSCSKCGQKLVVVVAEIAGGSMVVSEPELDLDATLEQPDRPRKSPPTSEPSTEEVLTRDPEPDFPTPRTVDGYRVGQSVGSSPSGMTFEARRFSVKGSAVVGLVNPGRAADARFVARFAVEAFAASIVRHPNLIGVRSVGSDHGLPFVVFDRSSGFPLSDPARGRAGLDRAARTAAILQAARGLRAAHEHGLYHRNLTLGAIRIDPEGRVQVVGIGLGLTPETPETVPGPMISLDGPDLSPEPLRPSAAQADVHALGRCLLTLISGPEASRAVPPGLARVSRRMAGQGDEPGFPDLGSAVRALESELGVTGPFTPRDDEATELMACAQEFDAPPMVRLRRLILIGSAGFCGLIVTLLLILGKPVPALGTLGFGLLTGWSIIKVRGFLVGDPVFDRVINLILGGTRGDRLTFGVGLGLVILGLWASGLFWFWLFLGLVAVGLATASHYALDRSIATARAPAIERARTLLRNLRRQGIEETDLRRFVCRQAGPRWEEFFESLLGYDAMRSARSRWGADAGGHRRPRFAPWRDPIADFLDAQLEARRFDRDQIWLQGTEERGLEARGINLLTARRKAHRAALAMVSLARQALRSPDQSVGLPLKNALVRASERPEEFLAAIETLGGPTESPGWRDRLEPIAESLLGPRIRFLVGSLFLAGFLVWMHQNSLIDTDQIHRQVLAATNDSDQAVAHARELGQALTENVRGVANANRATADLNLAYLPEGISRKLDGFGLGLGGLILILSSGFRSLRFAAFAVPGALIAAVGSRIFDPNATTLGSVSVLAMMIGVGLFGLGVILGRVRT